MNQIGLSERINYFPSCLSCGQKQCIAIARALVCKLRLILADEPTAALDSQRDHDVVILLVKLARETGSPVLMVTHDARILDIADRIVSFEDGRIVNSHRDTAITLIGWSQPELMSIRDFRHEVLFIARVSRKV